MKDLENKVLNKITELSLLYYPSSFLIACSGGCDSAVLLDILGRNKEKIKTSISVIYINHGWSENAQFWGEVVENMAEKWGFCCEIAKLNLDKSKNPEAVAREARYKKFAEVLPKNGVLLTAHQENDQAETFLINLLRASGLEGLSAMPERKKFAQGEHWRVMLGISRKDLEKYAQEKNLKFVNDESNQDTKYQRNWLRLEILEKIAEVKPQIYQNIAFSAQVLAQSRNFQERILDKILNLDFIDILELKNNNLDEFLDLIIRRWLFLKNLKTPPQRQLLEFIRQVKSSDYSQCEYSDLILYFYNNKIKIVKNNFPLAFKIIDKNGFLKNKDYEFIYYQNLEEIKKNKIRKKIKNLKMPLFLKNKLAVLLVNNQIVWVEKLGFLEEIKDFEVI